MKCPSAFSGLADEQGRPASPTSSVAVPLVNLGQLRGIFVFQVRDDVVGKILVDGHSRGQLGEDQHHRRQMAP